MFATSATVIEAVSDSDNDDVDAVLDGILGGESNTPIPIYNIVYRTLVLMMMLTQCWMVYCVASRIHRLLYIM